MKQVNFVNSSIQQGGFKYPSSYFCVYLEKNAHLKQETSEKVVKSIHHIINLKSSQNKE